MKHIHMTEYMNIAVTKRLKKCYGVFILFLLILIFIIMYDTSSKSLTTNMSSIKNTLEDKIKFLVYSVNLIDNIPKVTSYNNEILSFLEETLEKQLNRLGYPVLDMKLISRKSNECNEKISIKAEQNGTIIVEKCVPLESKSETLHLMVKIDITSLKDSVRSIIASTGLSYTTLIYGADVVYYSKDSGFIIFGKNIANVDEILNKNREKIISQKNATLMSFPYKYLIASVRSPMQFGQFYTVIIINKGVFLLRFFAIFMLILSGTSILFHHLRISMNQSISHIITYIKTLANALEEFRKNQIFEIERIKSLNLEKTEIKELELLSDNFEKMALEITSFIEELKDINEFLGQTIEELSEKNKELETVHLTFSQKLAMIAEGYDKTTGNHILRVGELSAFLAEKLGMDKKFIKNIRYYAQLHDIGKILVPREILSKPGRLTKEEFEEMKKHTVYGAELLSGLERFKMAYNIALYHHEKYNGKGYPFGKKGDEIPIEAQIVAIVDVYDALRSERPYKEALTHEEAVRIITEGDERTSPWDFNPKLIEIFLKYQREIKKLWNEFSQITGYRENLMKLL